ncbi:MAG: hypothetical protein ACK5O1_04975 [Holosporales bacterium]|jgi:hypothetical protein
MYIQPKLPPVTEAIRGDFFWQRGKAGQQLVGGDKMSTVTLEAGSRYVGGKGYSVVDALGASEISLTRGTGVAYLRGDSIVRAADRDADTIFVSGSNNALLTDVNDEILMTGKGTNNYFFGTGGILSGTGANLTRTNELAPDGKTKMYRYTNEHGNSFSVQASGKYVFKYGPPVINIVA